MHTDIQISRRQIVTETWPLLVAVLVVCVPATWPLALGFFTHLPGPSSSSDTAIALWDFWWFLERAGDWFPNPYHTDMMFHPLGTPLAQQGTHFLYALLTAPIVGLFGLIPAINAVCLWTFLASAAAFYWLARLLGFSRWACYAGAILFAFFPGRIGQLQSHISFLAADWGAFYALCGMALLRTNRWVLTGMCAGMCMAACLCADLTLSMLLVLSTAIYFFVFVRPLRQPGLSRRLSLGLAVATGIAILLTLPCTFASYLPLVNNARAPERFHGVVTLPFCLALVAGLTFLVRRVRRPRLAWLLASVLCALCLLIYAAPPLTTFQPDWDLVKPIRDDLRDVAVLDGLLNNRDALVHQVAHGKKTITGHAGSVTPEVSAYMAATPVLNEFTLNSSIDRYLDQPAADEMTRRVVDFLDIRYAIVDYPGRTSPMTLFEGVVPSRMVAENGRSRVYELEFAPASGVWPGGVIVGQAEWSLYLAHGWGQTARLYEDRGNRGVIWPASPMASVLFKCDKPQTVGMGFETFLPPSATGVRMSVTINGRWFKDVDVPTGKQVLRLAFDDALVHAGLNEVAFRWPYDDGIYRWSESGYVPANIFCVCGAKDKRLDAGSLEINGQRVHANEGGYNIIELADNANEVLRATHFDAYADAQAISRIAEHVESIPEGRLVVLMGAVEASKDLNQQAVDALGALGAAFDMREKPAWTHIAVGRKGMHKGDALETYSDKSISILAPGRCGFSAFQFFAVNRKNYIPNVEPSSEARVR